MTFLTSCPIMTALRKNMIHAAKKDLPQFSKFVIGEGKKYFAPELVIKAMESAARARALISFSKGSRKTYFICSGIVKDEQGHKSYESKISYKKRLEKSKTGPVSSLCSCSEWNTNNHCSHAATLYILFLLQEYHDGQLNISPTSKGHLPISINSDAAVSVSEYGTILNGVQQLDNTSPEATYSNLQYLLSSNKITNFPIPENFNGKLIAKMSTSESSSSLRFAYESEDGKIHNKISIFETIYLFNWATGEAIYLPGNLKNFVQKVQFQETHFHTDDFIKLTNDIKENHLKIFIDDIPLNEIPRINTCCHIHLRKVKKSSRMRLEILFCDEKENIIPAPDFLTAFTFQGGLLESFHRKLDALSFIRELAKNIDLQNPLSHTKSLSLSSQKARWQMILNYTFSQKNFYSYDPVCRHLYQYDSRCLIVLYKSLVSHFEENLFRSGQYEPENKTLYFKLNHSNSFQGIYHLYHQVIPFGVQIFYDQDKITPWTSKIRFERKSEAINWFDLELSITDHDLEIIREANTDSNLAFTKKGLILLSKEQKYLLKFLKKYTHYEKQKQFRKKKKDEETSNTFILNFNRSRIFELFELKKLGIDGALTKKEIKLCEQLSSMEKMPQFEIPEKFVSVLRPYQKTGYTWLRFLYENQLGACLADDMGLGKTLQTIAFLQSIHDTVDKILIVCPVTIILNWEKEFKRFSDMDVFIYHGENRTLLPETKILITSYGIMKREVESTFSNQQFDVFILDEVQHLKNIQSQGAHAARKINARYRICLTGTPIENDLAEFYNILDLSVPGIWGDLHFVRTTSTKKSRMLAKKTARPFILRRAKNQILTELPPKVENNVFLNFSKDERENYLHTLIDVRHKIEQLPSQYRYGEILKGLLKLRQKCLWQKRTSHSAFPLANVDSTKIKFLLETLEPIIKEGHQAIIFSQFTTYLDIIQNIFQEYHWKLARIDGTQTMKHRQREVDKFQAGQCRIFLISLKAGGVGLNLTAASYVFIMDPWWNPAVENQAIDRAHRIGQQNPLTVYRPIMKDSVEEKVLQLQEVKKELFHDLLSD